MLGAAAACILGTAYLGRTWLLDSQDSSEGQLRMATHAHPLFIVPLLTSLLLLVPAAIATTVATMT